MNYDSLQLSGKNVMVLGLGDTGLSCVRWLAARGAQVSVADSRAAPPHAGRLAELLPQVPLFTGPFDGAQLQAAELLVVSPGVPLADPAVARAVAAGVEAVGDVGALALGAALGVVAVIVRQEIILFIMCGVFVVETLSVMVQVASFKLTGKRVFRMAPIHHHFELKGWKENQVVVRFWIISMMLVLIGLSSLKLR